jgi:hypothetical protein
MYLYHVEHTHRYNPGCKSFFKNLILKTRVNCEYDGISIECCAFYRSLGALG